MTVKTEITFYYTIAKVCIVKREIKRSLAHSHSLRRIREKLFKKDKEKEKKIVKNSISRSSDLYVSVVIIICCKNYYHFIFSFFFFVFLLNNITSTETKDKLIIAMMICRLLKIHIVPYAYKIVERVPASSYELLELLKGSNLVLVKGRKTKVFYLLPYFERHSKRAPYIQIHRIFASPKINSYKTKKEKETKR